MEHWQKTFQIFIKWFFLTLIVYEITRFLHLTLIDIKGTDTAVSANVIVKITSQILGSGTPVKLFIALLAISVSWAIMERNLRHRKTRQMEERVRSLESKLDKVRSSSNLTPEGKTNLEDT